MIIKNSNWAAWPSEAPAYRTGRQGHRAIRYKLPRLANARSSSRAQPRAAFHFYPLPKASTKFSALIKLSNHEK
jgi:hypothetical protein